ncbi:lipoprotein [Paenibacillus tengchongensis]|uniref:lipoprotein n=1 Tax=Paenibacillus tengchongensis TaxID=2608684 RepID=UPI00124CC58F|nr:lipoprotein [Paenibacillus tengchongensis]
MKKIVLAILLLLILSACGNEFTKESWLDKREERSGMVSSLLQKHELTGMTVAEVKELLGEPEQIKSDPTEYVYYLGRAGLGVDDLLFRLTFDEDGKLITHEQTHD